MKSSVGVFSLQQSAATLHSQELLELLELI